MRHAFHMTREVITVGWKCSWRSRRPSGRWVRVRGVHWVVSNSPDLMSSPRTPLRCLVALTFAAACSSAGKQRAPTPANRPADDDALIARARAIHQRVMTLDTHVDINANQFNPGDSVNFAKGVPGRQVD